MRVGAVGLRQRSARPQGEPAGAQAGLQQAAPWDVRAKNLRSKPAARAEDFS
jgi:hypothetical protein